MENQQALEIFRKFRETHSQREVAKTLSVTIKTVSRWEREESRISPLAANFLKQLMSSAERKPNFTSFSFIDLFAGIGGIRHGFESVGGQCLFTSEWNPWSKKTYQENYGVHEKWVDDIVPFPAEAVPDHDVLLAGFPCQPFSIAGVSKKNALGRPHGFECTTQGTLFFDVARIIARKRPAAFLLENVKNLVSHDKGNTLRVILQTLREDLGYKVEWKVIDGKPFVPQHRERILIAGFRQDTGFSWDDFVLPENSPTLKDILHPEDGTEEEELPFTTGPKSKVHKKYVLTDKLWGYLQAYSEKHRLKGNGFGFGLVGPEDRARTLSARYYKDGSEILVRRKGGGNPRRLTPRECARLMGFPDTFKIRVSDTQAYRQFGNSVVVPVMREAARIMLPHVIQIKSQEQSGLIQLPLFNWEVSHQREAV